MFVYENKCVSLLVYLIIPLFFQYGVCSGQLLSNLIEWRIKYYERNERDDRTKTERCHAFLSLILTSPPLTLFSSSSDLLGGDGRWTGEKTKDKEALKAAEAKLPQSRPLKNEKTSGPKEISAIERENKRLRQRNIVLFLKGCWNLLLILKRDIHGTETTKEHVTLKLKC